MMLGWLGVWAAAWAAEPAAFPWMSDVVLPPTGAARIEVPPALLPAGVALDTVALLLCDATGKPVPIARVTEGPDATVPVRVTPGDRADVWIVEATQEPFDALTVRFPDGPIAATVSVADAAGAPLGPDQRVWRLDPYAEERVSLPSATLGPVRLTLTAEAIQTAPDGTATGVDLGMPAIDGVAGVGPKPRRIARPVTGSAWVGDGWRTYQVPLDAPLPVRAVWLDPDADVFLREAVARLTFGEPDGWSPDQAPPTPVLRQRLSGSQVEHTAVPVPTAVGDHLEIAIAGAEPLPMRQVEVEVPSLWVLTRDAGPGPHRLYGGLAATEPPSDLQPAARVLVRASGTAIAPSPPAPNPDFVPPEAAIAGPGTAIDTRGLRWSRALAGAGLARIRLDPHVLEHARADLGDLRVLDAEGRQIPYLLTRAAAGEGEREVPITRVETGRVSTWTIAVDTPHVPLSTLVLETDAQVFSRDITVLRPRGGALEPLRVDTWRALGDVRPRPHAIAIDQVVGDTLLVQVDEGDDPPLSITRATLAWPTWDLVVDLPESGASLVYGDPMRQAPSYDLDLVREAIQRRHPPEATLGPVEALATRRAAPWERALVWAGILGLGVGLASLLRSVVRGAADAEDPPEPMPPAP
jgi:hypothetical protein